MPPSRKRSQNEHLGTGTLHQFFFKLSPAEARTASHSNHKSCQPRKSCKGKHRAFAPPPDAEIIVIDSDGEEAGSTSQNKRQLEGEGDASALRTSVVLQGDSSRKRIKQEVTSEVHIPGDLSNSTATKGVHPSRGNSDSSFGFGRTTTLLRSSASNSSKDSERVEDADNAWKPKILLQSYQSPAIYSLPDPILPSENARSSCRSETALPSIPNATLLLCDEGSPSTEKSLTAINVMNDIVEIDDEWGTGNDEFGQVGAGPDAFMNDELEAEDVIELSDSSPEDDVDLCPMCGRTLQGTPGKEVHAHTCTDPRRPSSTTPFKNNAFSVLMSSHKENEAWKEADVVEDRTFRPTKGNGGRRKAPFYKVMQGMPIAVDAFRYGSIPGVSAYFLTHAHSDHYTNLSSNWKTGPIYCSEGTAKLIIHMLSVDPKWVHPLPIDTRIPIPDSGGVIVTLIEANHCPGSSLFLFEGPQTVDAGDSTYRSPFVGSTKVFRYLHCGDFRASPQHVLHPSVKGKHLDLIYLDTTYLNPKYCFPSQTQVISACAELAKSLVSGGNRFTEDDTGKKRHQTVDKWFTTRSESDNQCQSQPDKTVVVVGTYSIGKERIVKAIANALQTKVYCDSRKAAILRCQSDPELEAMLTKNPFDAGVHIVPLGVVNSDKLREYTQRWKGHFTRAIAFRPTGWTYSPPAGMDTLPKVSTILSRQPHPSFTHAHLKPMRGSTATHQLFGVPYSEHSSFFELTCFAVSLDWTRIIATVNVGSESSRGKIAAWVARWEAERKKRGGPASGVVPYRTTDYW